MSDEYLTPRMVGFINSLYAIIKKKNTHLRIEVNLYEDECKYKNIKVHVTDGSKHIQKFIDGDFVNASGIYTLAMKIYEDMKIKEYFGGDIDDK